MPFDAPVLDVGAGVSPFLSGLLAQGYTNLIATDLSATALAEHRRQLPPAQAEHVMWVVDDLLQPQHLPLLDPVLFWHDRAVLHGFLGSAQTAAYARLLHHMVAAHGWVLLSARAPESAVPPTEAGLLLQPYTVADLQVLLGSNYTLQAATEEVHQPLTGDAHPYTYALFQRNATCRQAPWSA
ncbi:hypothetical protein LRS06_22055 [Hymenobacter sp. J193]|uniref:hypothetical protein n=1 Tax=Hymenobacter sp. J193 TaxID=2898429 RepID=UPI0021511A7D|nr:hypothetical protein [Hymenobacter sp. J193]MCR5890414.1 hypothetical protein [Hymenobacter sp. J193]